MINCKERKWITFYVCVCFSLFICIITYLVVWFTQSNLSKLINTNLLGFFCFMKIHIQLLNDPLFVDLLLKNVVCVCLSLKMFWTCQNASDTSDNSWIKCVQIGIKLLVNVFCCYFLMFGTDIWNFYSFFL